MVGRQTEATGVLRKNNFKERVPTMKKILLLGALVLAFGVSAETFGQRRIDRGDRSRIRQGVRSGRITREEARVLRERQRQIRQERRGYRSDGVITRDERREIRRDEREHDRLIRQARRNGDRRYDNGYYRGTDRRRGNGYYRRGAGSRSHPVFGVNGRRNRRR